MKINEKIKYIIDISVKEESSIYDLFIELKEKFSSIENEEEVFDIISEYIKDNEVVFYKYEGEDISEINFNEAKKDIYNSYLHYK